MEKCCYDFNTVYLLCWWELFPSQMLFLVVSFKSFCNVFLLSTLLSKLLLTSTVLFLTLYMLINDAFFKGQFFSARLAKSFPPETTNCSPLYCATLSAGVMFLGLCVVDLGGFNRLASCGGFF